MSRRNARQVADALGDAQHFDGYSMGCCPAHNDSTPSLRLSDGDDGRLLWYCYAGCSQEAVEHALRERRLWPFVGRRYAGPVANGEEVGQRTDQARTEAAMAIWRKSWIAAGSLVETYLRSRSINLPPPPSLRFVFRLGHYPSQTRWPAMLALVTRGIDGMPVAIHRTYLSCDGEGKAPVGPQRMMLGPCRGGVVRLGTPTDELLVGEGIETCLTGMEATDIPAWAALSTTGMETLELPASITNVTILADADPPGERAADRTARRWMREGRRVRIA